MHDKRVWQARRVLDVQIRLRALVNYAPTKGDKQLQRLFGILVHLPTESYILFILCFPKNE